MNSKDFKTQPAACGGRSLSIRNARRSLAGKNDGGDARRPRSIALASAGAALLFTDLRDNRAAWAEDLRTEAGILSLAVHAGTLVQRSAKARSAT